MNYRIRLRSGDLDLYLDGAGIFSPSPMRYREYRTLEEAEAQALKWKRMLGADRDISPVEAE